ncbi:MAG: phage tail sheath subtilisin-like domain-containing protein [Candidatus Accumulibacter sp.]|jgi:phage tail sheath protein FI|nr:phage tail sheath subtilisin-like domain-containing protein [Accumulibacter sp.]
MAANFLHGAETIFIDSGPRPVTLVKTAVIGLIGTAAAGAVNEPILVTNESDFAQFGEDLPNSTIRKALERIYKQKGTVCIVLNVLDPAVHQTLVNGEIVPLDLDGSFKLAHAAVQSVTVTDMDGDPSYVENQDYTIDLATGQGARIATGSIPASTVNTPAQIKVAYAWANPSLVQPSEIIGTIDAAGRRRGLKAFRDSYQLFGYYPKILVAPVFSTLNSVSAELIVTAESIRAFCFISAPIGTTVQQAITGRGPLGAINFNTSSRRVGLCFPHVKDYDTATDTETLADLATYAAGALSRKDQENGYWWSPSNTELLGVTGMETPIDAMINDANCEANLLNEAGIITVFNSFGTGIRLWGNRSAAFPSETHPKNFINVQRVADVIAESLEYYTLQYIDRPLNQALIDAIVESGNAFLRKLKADDAILDGKCWYDPAQNEATELAAGHVTFTYDFMPPTPSERVTYRSVVNLDYLKQLGGQSS